MLLDAPKPKGTHDPRPGNGMKIPQPADGPARHNAPKPLRGRAGASPGRQSIARGHRNETRRRNATP